MADGMAKVVRRPGGRNWTGFLCPALVLLGLAVLGSHWPAAAADERFTGIYLACSLLIVELAIRMGKTQGRSPWALCSLASALVLLLLFRLAGRLELGFAIVVLYALGSMAMLTLTGVKPMESPAKGR
jgi:chromate transport protein ChrA